MPPVPAARNDAAEDEKLRAHSNHELGLGPSIQDNIIDAVDALDLGTGRQLVQAPPLLPAIAAAPPPAAPVLYGLEIVLAALANLQEAVLQKIDARADALERKMAIGFNGSRGTGQRIPYMEVFFLDGTPPTVARPAVIGSPARPALPLLNNVGAIKALTAVESTAYGYMLSVAGGAKARRTAIAQYIGCSIPL
ncbi:hypothetical protein R3P38DRAFT_1225367 [Favolaschia claudopus]|uniref:Mug135-like C-terminal domain-containing protein n=1 Tax=Favolaschia claudopus TaxID=2862362 RepID=A0AAW0B3R7_9AGAR